MNGVRREWELRDAAAAVREPEAEPAQASLIKKLTVNFDTLHVAAIANRIYVYEPTRLKPIDILSDHQETVRGLDVSTMLRNIVSFSREATSDNTTFMVHCLVDSDHVQEQVESQDMAAFKPRLLQDEAVYLGCFKWQLTFKAELSAFRLPTCMAISPIGDFCVMAGSRFVSLWTVDTLMDSYTQQVLWADKQSADKHEVIEQTNILHSATKQVEVCGSGRLFATLAEGAKTVTVWWNIDTSLRAPGTVQVDFRRFYLDDLPIEPYELPKHRHEVSSFKMLPGVRSNQVTPQPCVILTMTQHKAFVWVESLEVPEMAFNCLQSFSIGHDACFLELSPLTSRADKHLRPIDLKFECSKIFHSYKDEEKRAKNALAECLEGIMPSSIGGNKRAPTSLDWLLILKEEGVVEIVKCKGLRDTPSTQVDFAPFKRLSLAFSTPMKVTQLLSAQGLTRDQGHDSVGADQVTLLLMNESCNNMFKARADLANQRPSLGIQGGAQFKATLLAAIRVNPTKYKVTSMLAHPSLPLVALTYQEVGLVEVYRLEPDHHNNVNEHDFSLHGSFQLPTGGLQDVQWVPQMDQLLVLTQNGTQVSLVSADSAVKMVAHFGDKNALQEQVTATLSKDASQGITLTSYKKIATFDTGLLGAQDSVKALISLSCDVRVADHPHTNPSQTLCFATVRESGASSLIQATFQVDMDNRICDQEQRTLHTKKAFDQGFRLSKVVASTTINKTTYLLCLAQKDPQQVLQAQSANHRGPVKKPQAQLQLISVSEQSGFGQQFLAPGTAEYLLEHPIVAKFSSNALAILIHQGSYAKEQPFIYIYSLESSAYQGFIDVGKLIGHEVYRQATDFEWLEDKIKGAIALTCMDKTFVLFQKQSTWDLLTSSNALTNVSKAQSIRLASVRSVSKESTIVSLINDRLLAGHPETQLLANLITGEEPFSSKQLHRMIVEKQRSQSLFHPKLLHELYIKGYASFVVKILLKLKNLLEEGRDERLSDYLDMDLESLLTELKTQSEALAQSQSGTNPEPAAAPGKKKPATAFSVFDDLDESDSDDAVQEEVKEEEKADDDPKKVFRDSAADQLVTLLTERHAIDVMGLATDQTKELVTFVLKFKNVFEIDFYVDPLASMLLRKVYFETEKLDQAVLDDVTDRLNRQAAVVVQQSAAAVAAQLDESEANFMNYQVEEVKPFSMEEYMALRQEQPQIKSAGDLDLCNDWNSAMVCQALHSENQEVIMNFLAERFEFEQNLTWGVMKKLSIPIWLKDTSQVKKYIEYIAKTEYRVNEGTKFMCKADHAALWYTLLGKRSVLQNLYSLENGLEKFAQFFTKDFTVEKTRTIAQKNALSLVAKQKYHVACSFMLLAQRLDSAVQVALDRLKDPGLAILMCRVHDPEDKGGILKGLLQKWFVDRGSQFNDPYLMSIGCWLQKDFVKAVNQLSPNAEDPCVTYLYKNDVSEFDLVGSTSQATETEADRVYPLVSKRSYIILDLVKRLRKAPDVKRALNKDWANAKAPGGKKGGGASSIFDDFLGGGSDSSSEEEEEKKEQIEVEDSAVLRQAVRRTLDQRQTLIGLLLIEENSQLKADLNRQQVERLTHTLLLDLVINIADGDVPNVSQGGKNESISHLRKGLTLLAAQLSLPSTEACERFLIEQLDKLGLLRMQIEMLTDSKTLASKTGKSVGDITVGILEDHARSLQAFVQSTNLAAGASMRAYDYDTQANQALAQVCEGVETLLNCMLILKCSEASAQGPREEAESPSASRAIHQTLKKKSPSKLAHNNSRPQGISSVGFSGLSASNMQNKGDNDDANMDSDEEEAKYEINQRLGGSPLLSPDQARLNVSPSRDNDLSDAEQQNLLAKQRLANTATAKLRTDLLLVMTLQTIALLLGKYNLGKELCEDLQIILGVGLYADKLESLALPEHQLEQMKTSLRLNQIKESLSKLKKTLGKNIAHSKRRDLLGQGQKRRRGAQDTHIQWQGVYDFLDLWFKQMLVARTSQLLQKSKLGEIKVLGTRLLAEGQEMDHGKIQELMVGENSLNTYSAFSSSLKILNRSLSDTLTYTFVRVLKPVDQRLLTCELEQIVEERYRCMGKSLNLAYLFTSLDKLRYYGSSFEVHIRLQKLQDLQLGLTGQRSVGADGRSEADLSYQNTLLSTGIELFKQRQEAVVDICFDRTGQQDMMAMAIQAKGMREISVTDTLIYRNRRERGLEMIDEDQMSWAECLKRYEPIQQVHNDLRPSTDAVRSAVYGLYSNTTATSTERTPNSATSPTLLSHVATPERLWDGQPSSSYAKTYSDLRITHDDYTNAVDSHPFLPLYVSGNAKGLICMWQFGQQADKSLNQWVLDKETPPNQANPKKTTVKKIEFNAYGDKFAALNTGGQFFMMGFDLETHSKVEPLYSTMMSQKLAESGRLSDFTFLDRDSLIAGVSLRDKVLNIYDTAMPPRTSLVQQHRGGLGGNLIQLYGDANKVLCFNGKPGYVTEYDLRKEGDASVVALNKLLAREEISAVAISPRQETLVVGTSDGLVKLFDLSISVDNAAAAQGAGSCATSEKCSMNAFTSYGRKGPVTRLRFHEGSGALFAASNIGCVKLLRMAI